tara:strand:+ start:189 stop:539 length:351 start_codon:yes stop_codon:yes gene_type:complete
MKYKEHIINYAIDNKVSLEEAYKHFIIKGRDEKEEKFKKEYMDDTKEHFEDEDYEEPLSESALSPEEEEAWKMYDSMKDNLERLYKEYAEAPLTKEEMAWVEHQLRMIDQIRDNNE